MSSYAQCHSSKSLLEYPENPIFVIKKANQIFETGHLKSDGKFFQLEIDTSLQDKKVCKKPIFYPICQALWLILRRAVKALFALLIVSDRIHHADCPSSRKASAVGL